MNYWVDGKMHLAWTAQWSWPCWEGQRWENPRTWEWETSPTTHAIRQRGLGRDASSNASGRWESWGPKSGRAAPALAEILRRTGPVPHLCSTREPALLAEVWMSQPRTCEHERTVPITYLSCAGVGGREIPPWSLTPHCQWQMRERIRPLAEGKPFSLPAQYHRNDPVDRGMRWWITLSVWE